MNKFIYFAILMMVTVGVWACGSSPTSNPESAPASAPAPKQNSAAGAPAVPTAPPVPDEMQKAAEKSLGAETDVLLFGDLAKDGSQQILAVNRMKMTPQVTMPGTVITRGVILEKKAGAWKEILRCDEHLENPKGFLGNIPLAPVNGWRLQYEQDPAKGLQMYFTPVTDPKGARAIPVAVRWNPKTKRYQSLDRNFENFLFELPALETPESQVRL